MNPDCLFCKIAAKQIPATLAHEDESLVAFHDIHPAAPTHILIIPRKHVATLNDLAAEDEPLVGAMFTLARTLAAKLGFAERGYRVVFNCNRDGGQTVGHIHMHVLAGRHMAWPPG